MADFLTPVHKEIENMRFLLQRENKKPLLRVFGQDGEVAYASLGISGLQAEIEFPSDWHE